MQGLLVTVIIFNLPKVLFCCKVESSEACGFNGACRCVDTRQGFLVDCSDRGLSTIPANIPQNVSLLQLEQNNIKVIPVNFFHKLTNLTFLTLFNNSIQNLPENLFINNDQLMVLFLSDNYLSSLQPETFRGLTDLLYLNISFNSITSLEKNIFKDLGELRTLDLKNNKLKDLPSDLFALTPNLAKLDMDENFIEDLPSNIFENSEKLESLSLSGNNLRTIPSDIFNFTLRSKLIVIDFARNRLEAVPKNLFDKTSAVKYIDLSGNNLVEVKEDLFASTGLLQFVYLDNNKLQTLPDGLLHLTPYIKELNVSNNELQELPETLLAGVTNIFSLYANNNRIRKLPKSLFSSSPSPGVLTLELTGNLLTEIPHNIFPSDFGVYDVILNNNTLNDFPSGMFEEPVDLGALDLSRNNITTFGKDPFARITDVDYLYLSMNSLTELPRDVFRDTAITALADLSDNKIAEIPPGLFTSNNRTHKLAALLLHRNSLTYIPKEAFKGLNRLVVLTLFGNNINLLEDSAFSKISYDGALRIYLFENDLTEINNDPFGNYNVKEVHLFGNEIKHISGRGLCGLKNDTKIYISCGFLSQIPQDSDHDIQCVSPASVPGITTLYYDIDLTRELGKAGFDCVSTELVNTCVPCQAGSYGDGIHGGCQPCPKGGYYQDELGKFASTPGGMSCKECNVGTYVKNGHGTSIRDCEVCPEGTDQSIQAGFRACRCKSGYARTDRYGPCFICVAEPGLDCSEDFKMLRNGYFWYWNFPSANISNYRLFVANLKTESKHVSPHTNYTSEIPNTFICPRSKSCLNNNSEIQGQCADGYTGWLCTRCLPGYYSVLNTCVECPDKASLILEIIAFVAVCVFICLLFSWQLKRDKKRDRQTRSFVDVVISRVKILLGFYQVVGEIFSSIHDISWKGPLVIIGAFISSLELNILRLFVRPRCISEKLVINPKVEFIIGISCPIVIMTITLCVYQTRKLFLKCQGFFFSTVPAGEPHLARFRTRLITCVIVLLFLFYPPICSVIFELYPKACKTFYLDKDKIYNVTRLRSDYDFDCKDLTVYQTCAYIFTCFYVVMFPTILLYMLWVHFSRESKSSSPTMERRMSSQDDESRGDELTPLVINSSGDKPPSVPLWLSFLCENYKRKYWFWEIIELSRKVTQTMLITLYGWEDPLTVLLTTCISVMFLLLHAWYRPMKESNEQRLQMFSLTVIFINVVVAANDTPKDDYEESISVILILLNVLVLVIILGEVLMTLVAHIKHAECFETFVDRLRRLKLKKQKR